MSNIATAKLILKALKKAYKMDKSNVYALPKSVTFFFRGVTPEWNGTFYNFTPVLSATTKEPIGTMVTLNAYGRLNADGLIVNDGATFAPDTIKGAKQGAAVHDPGYCEMDDIAKAWSVHPYAPGMGWGRDYLSIRFSKGSPTWTRADVRQMFDDIFGDIMVEAGAGWFATAYHNTVRLFGGLFHDIKKKRSAVVFLTVSSLLLAGCFTPADVADWIEGLPEPVKLPPVESPSVPTNAPAIPPVVVPPVVNTADAVPYNTLVWKIGRTQPAVSAPAVTATIRAGKISASQLTFSWTDAKDAGKALGSSTHDPAELRAYVFFGGEGGFFDWCSVTRSERDFNNITGTFAGWDNVNRSRRPVTFFIGSKDGRSRTNIISFK